MNKEKIVIGDLDLTPSTHSLVGGANSNLGWRTAISELVDNSFDAGASSVTVTFGPKSLVVEDDGLGCGDCEAMLARGKREQHITTKLGVYGLGLKHVAEWLWGTVWIETKTKDGILSTGVCWETLRKSGKWDGTKSTLKPPDGTTGTKIAFTKIRPGTPKDYKQLIDEISYLFTPALLQGRQIKFVFPKKKPVLATPYKLPPLEHVIVDEFKVGTKSVTLHVGVVKDGVANTKPGFTYCLHHRVVLSHCVYGAGDKSTKRIAGNVMLGDKWKLSVHKDDITSDRDRLGREVYKRSLKILDIAASQEEEAASSAFDAKLNSRLRAAIDATKKKKGKRKSPKSATGTVNGTGKGGNHKNAAKKQPGNSIVCDDGNEAGEGLARINWKPFDSNVIGEVDLKGKAPVVWLNENDPWLKAARADEDVRGVMGVAAGMYVRAIRGDTQKQLPGINAPDVTFEAAWANVLKAAL